MKKKVTQRDRTWAVKNTNPSIRAPYTIIMEEHFHDLSEETKKPAAKPAAKKRTVSAEKKRTASAQLVKTKRAAAPAKRKTSAPAKKKAAAPAKTKSGLRGAFGGATEISMTANKISVTKKVSENRNGRFEQHEVRTYHDKTPENMRALQNAIRSGDAKKVTVKFK